MKITIQVGSYNQYYAIGFNTACIGMKPLRYGYQDQNRVGICYKWFGFFFDRPMTLKEWNSGKCFGDF